LNSSTIEEGTFVPVGLIFERAYQYFIESFYLQENPKNLETTFQLYQAFFQAFKSQFMNSELKMKLDNPTFFNVNSLFMSAESSISATYKTEVYLMDLFSKNLQKRILTTSTDNSSELRLIKDFLLLRIVQIIAFTSPSICKLQDCFALYQGNEALQSLIFRKLTFPIQKCILASALNLSTIKAETSSINLHNLCNLLCSAEFASQQGKEDYLTNLFQAINLPYSFSQLIKEIFQELPSRRQSDLDFLSSFLNNKEALEPQVTKFAPRIIQLPETFREFNAQYSSKKCSLCKDYTSHLFTSICFICGEVLCTAYCHNNPNQAGNLNTHAKKYHMGMGFFLDVQNLHQNFVNAPMNLSLAKNGLYMDFIGRDMGLLFHDFWPTKLRKVDFVQFKINPEIVKEFQDIIIQQTIRKDIFATGIRINQKSNDGFL